MNLPEAFRITGSGLLGRPKPMQWGGLETNAFEDWNDDLIWSIHWIVTPEGF